MQQIGNKEVASWVFHMAVCVSGEGALWKDFHSSDLVLWAGGVRDNYIDLGGNET